jgi:hypothetical protein
MFLDTVLFIWLLLLLLVVAVCLMAAQADRRHRSSARLSAPSAELPPSVLPPDFVVWEEGLSEATFRELRTTARDA